MTGDWELSSRNVGPFCSVRTEPFVDGISLASRKTSLTPWAPPPFSADCSEVPSLLALPSLIPLLGGGPASLGSSVGAPLRAGTGVRGGVSAQSGAGGVAGGEGAGPRRGRGASRPRLRGRADRRRRLSATLRAPLGGVSEFFWAPSERAWVLEHEPRLADPALAQSRPRRRRHPLADVA